MESISQAVRLLTDSADRIFADHVNKGLLDSAEQGEFPEALLKVVIENGFHAVAVEDSGLALSEALAVLKVAGRQAVPLPLPEIILGNRWLGGTEEIVSAGILEGDSVLGVPWGRRAERVVGVARSGEAVIVSGFDVVEGTNLAGEPRDRIRGGSTEPLELAENGYALLALSRVVLMTGALEKTLDLSLNYVGEREQFGRPIAKFQAIQHYLAAMAGEVAAAIRSADAALAGLGTERQLVEVAQGKIRVGESVGVVAELAQQVHGAMGYTYEHQLHHFTRRLWSWRDEYGGERYWQALLGRHVAGLDGAAGPAADEGSGAIWDFVATRG